MKTITLETKVRHMTLNNEEMTEIIRLGLAAQGVEISKDAQIDIEHDPTAINNVGWGIDVRETIRTDESEIDPLVQQELDEEA